MSSEDGFQAFDARLRKGDVEAIEKLTNRLGPALKLFARGRVGQKLGAHLNPSDVVQSVWRTVIRRIEVGKFQFEENQDLLPLLYRIAKCKIAEAARSPATRRRKAMPPRDPEMRASTDEKDNEEAAATIQNLIAGFEERQKKIILLRLAGKTQEEIANVLGLTGRWVRKLLCDIGTTLKRDLEVP